MFRSYGHVDDAIYRDANDLFVAQGFHSDVPAVDDVVLFQDGSDVAPVFRSNGHVDDAIILAANDVFFAQGFHSVLPAVDDVVLLQDDSDVALRFHFGEPIDDANDLESTIVYIVNFTLRMRNQKFEQPMASSSQ